MKKCALIRKVRLTTRVYGVSYASAINCLYPNEIIIVNAVHKTSIQVIQHLSPNTLHFCENSPQALFMKATGHPVNLTFEPAKPQSHVDRTNAVIIV